MQQSRQRVGGDANVEMEEALGNDDRRNQHDESDDCDAPHRAVDVRKDSVAVEQPDGEHVAGEGSGDDEHRRACALANPQVFLGVQDRRDRRVVRTGECRSNACRGERVATAARLATGHRTGDAT